jgi:hypothetical protein
MEMIVSGRQDKIPFAGAPISFVGLPRLFIFRNIEIVSLLVKVSELVRIYNEGISGASLQLQ